MNLISGTNLNFVTIFIISPLSPPLPSLGRDDHPQGEDTTLFEEEENHPYFEQEFWGQTHFTFGGMSETHGPVVVSIKPAPQQVVREPGGHNLSR